VKSPTCFRPWSSPASAFAGFRFPPDVIVVAVRWYLRYNHSYRDVEDLLVERSVEVDHARGHVRASQPDQRFAPGRNPLQRDQLVAFEFRPMLRIVQPGIRKPAELSAALTIRTSGPLASAARRPVRPSLKRIPG
jgi:hypothetical protein